MEKYEALDESKTGRKCGHLNALENCYIHKVNKNKL
jgi:hypothetical protein